MLAGQYFLVTDDVLSVLVHKGSRRRILVWDADNAEIEPDYSMNYVYVAFGNSLIILETGMTPEADDQLLTYAALWYARYHGETLRYVGAEDPRLQDVG